MRVLKRDKPDEWGCVQAHEVWSTEKEAQMCPGHFWNHKFGTVPGSMSCVEKKFDLQDRQWEEYRGEYLGLMIKIIKTKCSTIKSMNTPQKA